MFNLKKIFSNKIKTKSSSSQLLSNNLFFGGDFRLSQKDNNFAKYIQYLYNSSPLYTAIKILSDNINSIDIILWDKKDENFVYDHPAINLINNPNP